MAKSDQMTAEDAIQVSRQALQDRNRKKAFQFALKASRIDPNLEEAWIIMAALSEPEESIRLLKRALVINPKSKKAREGMHWAIDRLKNRQPKTASQQNKEKIQAQKHQAAREKRWGIPLFITILLTGIVLLVWIGIPYLNAQASAYSAPRPKNMLEKPTLTPTPTPTATPTPTPTLTPTPTATPTADTRYSDYFYHSWDIPEEVSGTNDFWMEVDLSGQMLYAYRGDQLLNAFTVSTGTSKYPTVTGAYKIYAKLPTYTMIGPGYNLPDVPYVLFFHKGYSIHGTYWHSNFGTPMSHGCVNMYTNDAAWVYEQATIGSYVFVHY